MTKKLLAFAGLMVAALLLAPSSTNAQTTSELEAQVQALLAQIAALQGGASASGCYSFTADLTMGSTGASVTALQNFLISSGYSIPAGATGYFGAQTQSALSAWQAANGIAPAAGYFGPISRAKYNSMCTTPGGSTGDDDDDEGDDDDDFEAGDGEEASLDDYDASSGDDTTLEEGQEDAEVMEFEFDVEDSDVEVQRIEIVASSSAGNGEEDPWDVFESASLWFDGERVAEVEDLDDEDEWDDGESDGEYTFRFNGVDVVVGDGETGEFILSVTLQDNLDELDEAWMLWIEDEGIRALDEAGIDQYIGQDTDTVEIDIEEAGTDDELSIGESSDDVESMVLEVEDDEKSDWHTLAVMELDAEGDIELKDFIFRVLINEAGADTEDFEDVVNDLVIIIDGEEYDDWSATGLDTATATVTIDLDDEDIVIEDGESVDVEIQAEFLATSTGAYDEGTTVTVDVPSGTFDGVDAEGVDSGEDLGTDQLNGSYEGEDHTLRSEGISLDLIDTSAVAPVGGDEAQANYEIEFSVTSFGEDFWIEKSSEREAVADGDNGVHFIIEDGSGTTYATATVSSSLSSGSESGDNSYGFKVSEGQTRTFTLLVTLDNDGASETAGFYRAQITGVSFDADGVAGGESQLTTGLDDYETDTVFVDNDDAAN